MHDSAAKLIEVCPRRFRAQNRSVRLISHASVATLWISLINLKQDYESLALKIFYFYLSDRSHGTTDFDGELVATVCGVVERVNKLVYVRTLRAR